MRVRLSADRFTFQSSPQQIEKKGRSETRHDDSDGNFYRIEKGPSYQIGDNYQGRPEQGAGGDQVAVVAADNQSAYMGNDEADESQQPCNADRRRRKQGCKGDQDQPYRLYFSPKPVATSSPSSSILSFFE